ncbi:MAG: DNA (cytosine-5-)-methyltransferase [Mesorhizobium sp.]|nr:MAG: DNA cytosine methyltransferase [Mesorhizobium sp.]TIN41708.1 MAG: DNA (cytosine-5-)-methyltransferase [Mesorhizobium sp.]TJU86251.1 MAG: DNA (cytosine-5-)-methyltransferase [Mesorhizobium sp.]
MTYGSVCSGIEAASVAWEPLGWRPKFFSEIEAFPSAVLAHHYGSNLPGEPLSKNGVPNYGDFTTIPGDAGPVDLLVGGTPCQSFSVAGKRLGLDDPRGNLALEYVRLAKRLGARWVVWENVPGVFSSAAGRDFADFLGFLTGRTVGIPTGGWRGAGIVAGSAASYGIAWRVLDAQYIRVDGYARAVPQRRKRVVVVGYLGDWRRAAAVLLEPEGMQGDPAPRRKAGQGIAGTITGSAGRRGGQPSGGEIEGHLIAADVAATLPAGGNSSGGDRQPGTSAETAATMLVAYGGGRLSGPLDVSTALTALTAHGVRMDFEVETFVAHTLRGDGFDASEDGSGRGTPLVAVPAVAASLTRGADSAGKGGYAGRRQEDDHNLVAFAIQERAGSENSDAGPQGAGFQTDVAYTLEARHRTQSVALSPTVSVRRLMPHECARLQGFPDDRCRISWKGRPAAQCPDGPQYKAYGNSMAIPFMRWIGLRIDLIERLVREGKIP